MTQFQLHFPKEEAGTRLDAWAHYGSCKMLERKGVVPEGLYEVWFTQPSHRAENKDQAGLPSLKVATEYAEHRAIECVKDGVWLATRNKLREYGSELLRPTTGLTAVAMAIEQRPVGLIITGFDSMGPGLPNWKDNIPVDPWRDMATHDHMAEKKMLADLVDNHLWCGERVPTEVIWLGRPEL